MRTETLTLEEVFQHPERATYWIDGHDAGRILLRPLQHDDVDALGAFLHGMSPVTRRFSFFASYDRAMAQALCDAINRYDKLRFVAELPDSKEIIGLFEFSFDLPEGDLHRYALHGVPLDADTDCRFGPAIADAYQNRRLGSGVFPFMVEVARNFGKQRMILWGGVLADNARAIRFYEKQGFEPVGIFEAADGLLTLDMLLAFDQVRT